MDIRKRGTAPRFRSDPVCPNKHSTTFQVDSVQIGSDQRCPWLQLALPLGDLVGLQTEPPGQIGQRPVISQYRQGDLRLESRRASVPSVLL